MNVTDSAAPAGGWFIDLTEEQQTDLIGVTLTTFCNMRADTGLLIQIKDGTAYLYRPDRAEPLQYPVAGSRYERVPNTPARPALASALRYEESWQTRTNTLIDENGELLDGVDHSDYDTAQDEYERGLPAIFDGLLSETVSAAFSRSTAPAKEK
ncbi:hypothetical protein [Streptomyces anulatus]|uniref:hypothetical protein n=1 Tax=Streptomyces anulatus TaxID=1892 RepID=UPI003428EE7F